MQDKNEEPNWQAIAHAVEKSLNEGNWPRLRELIEDPVTYVDTMNSLLICSSDLPLNGRRFPLFWMAVEYAEYHYASSRALPIGILPIIKPYQMDAVFNRIPLELISLPTLEDAQFTMEKFMQQLRGLKEPLAFQMAMRSSFAVFLRRIAERKARLTKRMDGELLAGETIPKPGLGSRRMYRAVCVIGKV